MPSSRIKALVMLWCIAEVLVFVILVHVVGLACTLLAGLVTSAVGVALLRRAGAATLIKLRASFQGRSSGARPGGGHEVVDGALSVLGALALLLPGFISDIVGFALLVRPVRARAAAAIGGGRWAFIWTSTRNRPSPRGPNAIDLERGEWQSGDARRTTELPR